MWPRQSGPSASDRSLTLKWQVLKAFVPTRLSGQKRCREAGTAGPWRVLQSQLLFRERTVTVSRPFAGSARARPPALPQPHQLPAPLGKPAALPDLLTARRGGRSNLSHSHRYELAAHVLPHPNCETNRAREPKQSLSPDEAFESEPGLVRLVVPGLVRFDSVTSPGARAHWGSGRLFGKHRDKQPVLYSRPHTPRLCIKGEGSSRR